GRYHGVIHLEIARAPREVPIEIEVYPFALPRSPSLPILVGFSGRSVARLHGRDLTFAYARALVRHRLSPIGGSFEPPAYRMEGTRAIVDWRGYDAEIEPLIDAGVRMIDLRLPARASAAEREALLAEWVRHFRQRGWFDRLFDYTFDEPRS